MNALKASQEVRGDLSFVQVDEARLDATKAPQLEKALVRLLESGARRVVVDLSSTEFMDCRSLGVLVRVLKSTGRPQSLAVVGAHGSVARILALTGLDRVFALHSTTGAALAQMST